jgi:hypothetical protein
MFNVECIIEPSILKVGVITLTCTTTNVTNVWFFVSNILEKVKKSKWNYFYIMLFLMYWDIYLEILKSIS